MNTLKLETVTFRELEEHEVLVKVQRGSTKLVCVNHEPTLLCRCKHVVFATGIYSIGTRDCRGEEGGKRGARGGRGERLILILRTGAYPFLQLPMTPGHEVAGTIVRVGPSVTKWSTGDRVINRHHSNCMYFLFLCTTLPSPSSSPSLSLSLSLIPVRPPFLCFVISLIVV